MAKPSCGPVRSTSAGRRTQSSIAYGMVERSGAPGEAMQQLLLLVKRGEDGALAPEEVDVAGEAAQASLVRRGMIEVQAQRSSSSASSRIERPGIALGGEDGRARAR